MEFTEGSTITKEKVKYKKPKLWKIVVLNDDRTTMEYVVALLAIVFHKDLIEATKLMFEVHEQGSSVIGIYPKAVASDLLNKATEFKVAFNKKAKEMGETHFAYLKIIMEEDD